MSSNDMDLRDSGVCWFPRSNKPIPVNSDVATQLRLFYYCSKAAPHCLMEGAEEIERLRTEIQWLKAVNEIQQEELVALRSLSKVAYPLRKQKKRIKTCRARISKITKTVVTRQKMIRLR